MMKNIEDHVQKAREIRNSILDGHKSFCGKKFSTDFEAHGFLLYALNDTFEALNFCKEELHNVIQQYSRGTLTPEDKERAVNILSEVSVASSVTTLLFSALLEKYKDGVIHTVDLEGRKDD